MQEIQTSFEALIPFIQFGFIAGVVLAVVIGAARLGFKFAPWIAGAALLIYLLG
jgi:hypothetical protein